MNISDVMTKEVVGIGSAETLQAAGQKMSDLNVGSLPVVDDGRLAGVITDRDIAVRGVAKGLDGDCKVGEVMTTGVITCSADTSVDEAATLMRDSQIRRLYVVDGDRLAGVASLGDFALEAQTDEAGETLREISRA